MTRTAALYIAIRIVEQSGDPEAKEVIKGIEQSIHTLKNRKWNEEKIFAACDKVYASNGYVDASTFKRKDMPSHTDLAQVFKMSPKAFCDRYYPMQDKRPTTLRLRNHTISEWTQLFVKDYHKVSPTSQRDYNSRRSSGLPTWETIARLNDICRWTDLLRALGLKKLSKPSPKLKVKSHWF